MSTCVHFPTNRNQKKKVLVASYHIFRLSFTLEKEKKCIRIKLRSKPPSLILGLRVLMDRQSFYILLCIGLIISVMMWHDSASSSRQLSSNAVVTSSPRSRAGRSASPPPSKVAYPSRGGSSSSSTEVAHLNPIIDFIADNKQAVLTLIKVDEVTLPSVLYVGIAVETVAEARWAARDVARIFTSPINLTIACFVEKGCASGKSYALWESDQLNAAVYCGRLYFGLRKFLHIAPYAKFHLFLVDRSFSSGDADAIPFLRTSSQHLYTAEGSLIVGHSSWEDQFTISSGNRTVVRTKDLALLNHLQDKPKSGLFLLSAVGNFPLANDDVARAIEFADWKEIDLSRYNAMNPVLSQEALQLGEAVAVADKGQRTVEDGTSDLVDERQLYVAIAKLPVVKTICEIGFSAGHSASLWLRANPAAKVIMFDLFQHKYGRHNEEFLRRNGSIHGLVDVDKRLWTINGSSLETVPQFSRDHKDVRCEILSVDGGHFDEVPLQDMLNMKLLANPQFHILLVDDTNCESTNCIAVDKAIRQLEQEGKVAVLGRSAELVDGAAVGFRRGVTVMQYL